MKAKTRTTPARPRPAPLAATNVAPAAYTVRVGGVPRTAPLLPLMQGRTEAQPLLVPVAPETCPNGMAHAWDRQPDGTEHCKYCTAVRMAPGVLDQKLTAERPPLLVASSPSPAASRRALTVRITVDYGDAAPEEFADTQEIAGDLPPEAARQRAAAMAMAMARTIEQPEVEASYEQFIGATTPPLLHPNLTRRE